MTLHARPVTSWPATPVYFPSFVECAPLPSSGEGPQVINHWNPGRAGVESIDECLGRNYCLEAIGFCRAIGAPFFMVCVLKEMRSSEFGAVESAFIRVLANKATAGGNSPEMHSQEATSLARSNDCTLGLIRGVEAAARDFVLQANSARRPDIIYAAILEWLQAPDTWIAEVVALAFSGAAIKGALN